MPYRHHNFFNIFKFQALQANFSKNSYKNLYFLKKYDESLVDISGESLIKVVNIGSQWNTAFQMFPRLDNGPPTEFTLFWSIVDLLRFFRSSYKSSYWFDAYFATSQLLFFWHATLSVRAHQYKKSPCTDTSLNTLQSS